MARPATGEVKEVVGKNDTTFAIRFRAYGKRRQVKLGTKGEGWTKGKAETELRHVLADVERGIWRPATRKKAEAPAGSETFLEFASRWYAERETDWRESTRTDYRLKLEKHLLPYFGDMALTDISAEDVDEYARAKQREREQPVKGRHGMSNNSINATIFLLATILDVALEYERIPRNPAKGKRRRLKGEPRNRPVVWPEQLLTLLDACDASLRPLVATLGGAGLRIGEAVALTWADVDLAARTIRVRDSKTAAGVRTVDIPNGLADELWNWSVRSSHTRPADRVFRKRDGGEQTKKNMQDRMKVLIREANKKLDMLGIGLIAEDATPHALRRGYASLRSYLDKDPAYVMEQLGHSEPGFTLKVYARALKRRERLAGPALSQFDAAAQWARLGTGATGLEPSEAESRIAEPFAR